MGATCSCLECFQRDAASDPILDAEARARAAEAAARRQEAYDKSPHGKAAKKSVAKDKAQMDSAAHAQRIHDIIN